MDLRQQAKRTGLLGLALLVVAGAWWPGTLLDWLVTLAATTVVPWGLALVGGTESKIWRAAVGLAPLGAVGGALTWLAPVGSPKAITGVAMHAIVTALAALHGLQRLRARGLSPLDELAIDVGLLLLPIGAVWWIASRAGVQLLGFQEPIVELTAAHFHYAGFAAPLVIGGVGRIVLAPKGPAHLTYRVGALIVCAGVPLTAIGIATSRVLERPAAVTLALGVVIAASQIAVRAPIRARERSRVAPLMLIVSGATLLVTMALATLYALTGTAAHYGAGSRLIPIERMVQFHGAPNAVLFATLGLGALLVVDPAPRHSAV